MLDFSTAFWDFCQMFLMLALLKFIISRALPWLSFPDQMMTLVLGLASLTAVFYTGGQTILLPVLALLGFFVYGQQQMAWPKIKSKTSDFGRKLLAYFVLSMLFWWFTGTQFPDDHVVLHEDFHYYIQQAQLMMQHGVESNNFEISPAQPNLYHYSDLWILALLSKIASHQSIIFHALFQPLMATLAYTNIKAILDYTRPKMPYARAFAFWSLIISLPTLKFINTFLPVQPIFLSAFANPKLLILVALCSWAFLHYIQKNYQAMLIISLVSSLCFVSIAPAVLCFAGSIYLVEIIRRPKILWQKSNLMLAALLVIILAYIYMLYAHGAVAVEVKSQPKKPISYDNLHLIGLFLLYYAVYFVPLLFVGWRNFWAKCKGFLPLLLMPVGGVLATMFTRHLFVDAYQFYALSLVVFFSISIPLLWAQFEWQKGFKIYAIILLLLALRYNSQKYAYGLYPKTDYALLQDFQNKYPETKTAAVAYETSPKWQTSVYFIMPAYFAPDEFFLNQDHTQNFFWIGLYDGKMPENTFKNTNEAIVGKTQFQDFNRQHGQGHLGQNQVDFMQQKQIKALLKDKDNRLSPELKAKVKDSICLPKTGKTFYYIP
jgi:hypothetical protein